MNESRILGRAAGMVFCFLFSVVAVEPTVAFDDSKMLTVEVEGHPMAVWEKLPDSPPTAVVLLLHGRTWSSIPDFDLQVPGEKLSLMDGLTAQGFAVYALDARGYGKTPRDDSGWLTPNRAEADVAAVLTWIGKRRVRFFCMNSAVSLAAGSSSVFFSIAIP